MARTADNDADQGQIVGAQNYAQGQSVAGRPGAVTDANAANNQASGANGNQAGAIELARRQAMGQTPSAGAMQLQQGLNQASAQQRAMAGGARGSAALATAGANQLANTSNLQQQAFGNAGIMRANDMAAGRGMYGTATTAARGMDAAALGQANDFGVANAQAGDAYKLGMGNAAVGLGGVANANNGEDLTRMGTAMDPIAAQDQADQQKQLWLAQNNKQATADNKQGS